MVLMQGVIHAIQNQYPIQFMEVLHETLGLFVMAYVCVWLQW